MLWFVGMGVSGADSISAEAGKILKDADIVYLEEFTSPVGGEDARRLSDIAGGQFKLAKRWMVEDGREILDNAKRKNTVLLSYGDPYVATTHVELRTRAIKEKIMTHSVHAASSLTSMIGECGLHHYKIGRVATVMRDPKTASTPYYTVYRNLVEGSHTVLLLEYGQDDDFFLAPGAALEILLGAEKGQNRGVFGPSTFVIVASRIGYKTQSVVAGKISSLGDVRFGSMPHAIIIPGRMHFTESDALRVLGRCLDEPSDNSDRTKKISRQMIEKYAPMIRDAIGRIAPHYGDSPRHREVLENAELYVRDAENFLAEGKDDVAVLSIGYADGLVDALRIAKGLEPETRR